MCSPTHKESSLFRSTRSFSSDFNGRWDIAICGGSFGYGRGTNARISSPFLPRSSTCSTFNLGRCVNVSQTQSKRTKDKKKENNYECALYVYVYVCMSVHMCMKLCLQLQQHTFDRSHSSGCCNGGEDQ
eukprot:m.133367 g.133367  ORF g.133367 m.133367 type:complete len:129 (-) comp13099_c0_seq6:1198-1584(-)